ncbi:MAG: hypothetical protein OXF79_28630 [Chloroflexi bacterium]|nr:hypothetical protein [Chloroflexota bacterium]
MYLGWILAGTTAFFAFVFVVVLILTILYWNWPRLIPACLRPLFIRHRPVVALLAIGFVAVACLIWALNIPEPRIE